jgi:hypothetical protein
MIYCEKAVLARFLELFIGRSYHGQAIKGRQAADAQITSVGNLPAHG